MGDRTLPLLDRRGGRDIKKSREASTRSGRGGCSNTLFEFEQPPRLCRQWLLRNIFFVAQPPLLSSRGNDRHPNSYRSNAVATTAAVSDFRMLGPSPTSENPFASARFNSSSVQPPSGPTR